MDNILDTIVTMGPIPLCWRCHVPSCMFAANASRRSTARMELRHLRYLVAIADAGAFVRAADVLHVAQPALTRQMHDLEAELKAPLFDPGARRATLTLSGRACVRLARHVIHDTEQAVA